MKSIFRNILSAIKRALTPDHRLTLAQFERLESKKYQTRGGYYAD